MTIHARVLGVAQDAGVPHAGCSCPRCEGHRAAPLFPACLGLVGQRTYLIDATPAFPDQIRMLPAFPSAILLTHTHMGHVTGLLQLGEEACDSRDVAVHATPQVCELLARNEPWRRLVERRNIRLVSLDAGTSVRLEEGLDVESFPVRHRDVETVGYLVKGPRRTLLYLPDIDRWDLDLPALLNRCDLALLDGSFYSRDELPRQGDIPHPPITETLDLLAPEEAAKVRFTHFNHTNPVLDPDGPSVLAAVQGETIPLD